MPTLPVSQKSLTLYLQNVISGGTNHYPVSSQFMIGDYVTPGNIVNQLKSWELLCPLDNNFKQLRTFNGVFEPHHEKTCFLPYANNKGADQPAHSRNLISTFVVRYVDSMIPLVSISEISSLYPASLAVQASLCLTWSQTPKTGFLVTRFIWLMIIDNNWAVSWGKGSLCHVVRF